MEKNILKKYVENDKTQREIAKALNKGQTTIRYWLKKYDLKTLSCQKTNTKICKNCEEQRVKRNESTFCSSQCSHDYKTKQSYEKVKKGEKVSPNTLRLVMLKYNKKECEICKNTEWNGITINLVVDHIDGNSNNGHKKNLRLVCNNCDSQLPTYKGRNVGNGRHYRRQRYNKKLSY